MSAEKLFFPPDEPAALLEMKRRVREFFDARGRSDKANASMILRTCVMLGVPAAAYALILTNSVPPLGMLALAILMGVGMAGIGFGVGHDALHESYSHRGSVNRVLGLAMDMVGGSSYMWRLGHNIVHHTYTNIAGVDGDVAGSGPFRHAPTAEWRPHHRYQHLFCIPLYAFATLNWVFIKDYKDIFKSRWGALPPRTHRRRDIAAMLALKCVHYTWSIVVPLLVLEVSGWQFLIGYLAMHFTAGMILGLVFQLAHIVEGSAFPEPGKDGAMSASWLAHQLDTTANFANGNRLLTWYVGGLNHQIEHHLFPRVCSTHYPAICKIVQDVAREHGLRYHHYPTFLAALRAHLRWLKTLGTPDAAVASREVAA
jgi:linoleoyl-CoA desaturase